MKKKLSDIVDNQRESGDIHGYSYHNWEDIESIQSKTVELVISEIETQVQAMREDGEGDLREVLSFLNSLKKN